MGLPAMGRSVTSCNAGQMLHGRTIYLVQIWFYDHPRSVKHMGHIITIHNASCAYCDHGQLIRTRHPAKWHGPFGSLDEAEEAAKEIRRTVKRCQKCLRPAVIKEWQQRESAPQDALTNGHRSSE